MIKGYIDPGHASSTPGKRDGDFREYKSNREIAVKIKKLLEATGKFSISFTIDLDEPKDMRLSERAEVAKKGGADFLISVHSNAASDRSARGTSTFIHRQTKASVPFAEAIHSNLYKTLGTKNRGIQRKSFDILDFSYVHMLCCLTEGEFFTNLEAQKWMLTEDYSDKYAEGVAKGLCEFYDVEFVEKEEDPIYRVIVDGKQIFALREKDNIIRQLDTHIGKAKEIRLERV